MRSRRNLCDVVLLCALSSLIANGSLSSGYTRVPSRSIPQGPTTRATSAWSSTDKKKITYIKASNTRPDAKFGSSVALSGDGNTLAVGAVGEASASKSIGGKQANESAPGAGAVYVFIRDGGSWKQQAYVKASNTDAHDEFGGSLALSEDGSTLAVGARLEDSSAAGINGDQHDNSSSNSGAVYIFTRKGTSWSQQAYVKPTKIDTSDDSDEFGKSVTLSGNGNTVAVGAVGQSNVGGTVYVFTRTGVNWAQQAYLKSPVAADAGLFGASVALNAAGDALAVAARAVYLFNLNSGTWSQQARLQAAHTEQAGPLGAVAFSADGTTLAATAYDEGSLATGINADYAKAGRALAVGAAYVFSRAGNTWSQQAYVKPSNSRRNEQFGWALALSRDGDTLAVGARIEEGGATGINGDQTDRSAPDSGAVYVFTRRGSTWSQSAYVKASNTGAYNEFGVAVALTGDGQTLAVGAHLEPSASTGINANQSDKSALNAGAVYVYY
jgi:trimeric autotransporter adhesin